MRPGTYCKGSHPVLDPVRPPDSDKQGLTPRQTAWMLENKPTYYTGRAIEDIWHLPDELKFDHWP